MGEIPNRQIFSQSFLQKPLSPYFQIVNCVKSGDMETFKKILTKYQQVFIHDKNYTLIMRLKHTVLKFGLKKLNISYSRISLKDIQSKLSLDSVEETEQIVAKAIRDGVIDAFINHDEGFMQSKALIDVYSTNAPQKMLNKRIKFCMDLHKDTVRGLEYPPKEDKRDFGDMDEEKSLKEEDLLASLMDEMDLDDF
jgi:26S proteasome regulatory subunit N3